MPTFLLIRHGETEWNVSKTQQGWQDSALTQTGKLAVEQLSSQLPSDTPIIFTSDLGRAVETVDIIKQALPRALVLTDWRLRERAYGDMEGQPIDRDEKAKSFADPLASYRGSEPIAHMDERIKSFIRDCALLDSERFVVVAHNGVLSRFGHLFDDTHAHITHQNSTVIEFDIDYTDPVLQPTNIPAWRPKL